MKPDASDLLLVLGSGVFSLGVWGLLGGYVALLWVGLFAMAVGVVRARG